MRIEIESFPKPEQFATFQTWLEGHADEQEDYFIVYDKKDRAVPFRFAYKWILGCHRFALYDSINDELLTFFAEDFTDIGKYIFDTCNAHFEEDYEIIL